VRGKTVCPPRERGSCCDGEEEEEVRSRIHDDSSGEDKWMIRRAWQGLLLKIDRPPRYVASSRRRCINDDDDACSPWEDAVEAIEEHERDAQQVDGRHL
jgi:hypothetical protein